MQTVSEKIIQTIFVTAELYGKEITKAAALLFAGDLSRFPEDAVVIAFGRCRAELRNFPSVSEVISRIVDGRPGPEEAWALMPKNENDSAVWTEEMRLAYGAVYALMAVDIIAARMAFKEVYELALANARYSGIPPVWSATLGLDKSKRQIALKQALEKNTITHEYELSIGYEETTNKMAANLLEFVKTRNLK